MTGAAIPLPAIRVSEDFAGLRRAALELFEEMLPKPEMGLRDLSSGRTLAPGYYRRVGEYLLWLDRLVEIGLDAQSLALDDLTGLDALAAARSEFQRRHPPCGRCGQPLDSPSAFSCRCGWRKDPAAMNLGGN